FDTDAPNGAFGIVSNDIAPYGYAYLLVCSGRATLATCMFADFHNERQYLDRASHFFEEHVGVRVEQARPFGGFGNFAPDTPLRRGRLLYAGEAAGLQDALFGFGMRLAMLSGHLAGKAIVRGQPESYEVAVAKRITPLLKASATNRYLFELLGARGQRYLMRWASRSDDIGGWFHRNSMPGADTIALSVGSLAPLAPTDPAHTRPRGLRLHVVPLPPRAARTCGHLRRCR
ncbi:MAG: hypothetical protein LC118_21765, partial [Dehalococcoidia bacterium]|nr:hypothetical protein [Dehalococcoidia bacterium]